MKKTQHNSGTSLFLMEMILALLFLSLSSAACIQIFAAARKNRIQAEQWNQIQALTTSAGEALEGGIMTTPGKTAPKKTRLMK